MVSLAVAAKQQFKLPVAKLTVRVLDEVRQPVVGALVRIGFTESTSGQQLLIQGVTDAQGEFIKEGHAEARLLADASKEGYYQSGASPTVFNDASDGKWKPWNPIAEIILRPIGKPVPLFAKRVQTEIPVLDQPCGYDLEKGDWVAPYGKGATSDFIFTGHREYKSATDFDMRLDMGFSNPRDGILKTELPIIGKNSVFKWQREAPESGYAQVPQLRNAVKGDTFIHTFERSDVFFFRVRTVEQNGRIVSGNYGKISGGLRLDGINAKKTCIVLFTYYLNPTSLDRNIEWDPKRNMFQGLSSEENPREL